jgi:hypothetical protein
MKKYLNTWSISIALLHFGLSITLTLRSIVASLGRIDGLAPTLRERILGFGADILNFPLITLALYLKLRIGAIEWLIFILNSLLWGVGIYILGKFMTKVSSPK